MVRVVAHRYNRLLLLLHIPILILRGDDDEGDRGGAMSLRKTLLAVLVFAGTGTYVEKKRSVRSAGTSRPRSVLPWVFVGRRLTSVTPGKKCGLQRIFKFSYDTSGSSIWITRIVGYIPSLFICCTHVFIIYITIWEPHKRMGHYPYVLVILTQVWLTDW